MAGPEARAPCARVRAGVRAAAVALCAFLPMAGRAELTNDPLAGAGVRTRPAYDGSDSQVVEAIPLLRYFGDSWFVRTTADVLEGGAWIALAPGLHAGVQLAYEPGRSASESGFLRFHNVPDIDPGASVGAQLEWDHMFGPMPVTVLVRVRQDSVLPHGAQADLRMTAGVFHGGPLSVGVYTQETWADAKSAETFYGIPQAEAPVTGLPAFSAGSGLLFAGFGCIGAVDLGRKWSVVFSIESRHLHGDAAHSPLAERTSNFYASVGPTYSF